MRATLWIGAVPWTKIQHSLQALSRRISRWRAQDIEKRNDSPKNLLKLSQGTSTSVGRKSSRTEATTSSANARLRRAVTRPTPLAADQRTTVS
jgi:hypothetical protein